MFVEALGVRMSKTTKIISLASALGALVAPALVPQSASANTPDPANAAKSTAKPATVNIPRGEDLMSFTVHEGADGMVMAQHVSHASHASHVYVCSPSAPLRQFRASA